MNDQLALIEAPAQAKLTLRQSMTLDLVRAAHPDGIEASEAGAHLHSMKEGRWAHSADERCLYCGSEGKSVLEALKAKGLVRFRRAKGQEPARWLLARGTEPKPRGMLPEDAELPF